MTEQREPAAASHAALARWRALARRLALLAAAVAALLVLVSLAPTDHWMVDLTRHFRAQYVAAIGAGVLAARAQRRVFVPLALLMVAALVAASLVPDPAARVDATDADVTVLFANVLTDNTEHDRLVALVRDTEPDLVALIEVSPQWMSALEPLRDRWPHVAESARSDNFGVALLSRLPLRDVAIVELDGLGVPTLFATVETSPPIRVVVTHPPPPMGRQWASDRDRQLAHIARLSAAGDGRWIVAGDMNASPWSAAFQRLVTEGDLRRTMRGWSPTWPAGFPFFWTALDHVLVGRELAVVEARVLRAIGSDHHPVWARVR